MPRVLTSILLASCLLACKPAVEASSPSARVGAPAEPLHPDAIPMTAERWEILAKEGELVEHLGRPSLRLRGGLALLRDVEMNDGVIELDMVADPGVAFAGPVWHLQDEGNYEKLYLRTFLSGSREASQYTPVFNHVAGWQTYHGPDFNRSLTFRRNRWIPMRIVVSGGRADVYVQDLEEPLLHVDPLRLGAAGGRVGLLNESIPEGMGPASVYVSNVRVEVAEEPPTLRGSLREPVSPRPGLVTTWLVSSTFAASSLEGVETTPDPIAYEWAPLRSEATGLANLARVHPVSKERDTAFARVTVQADEPGLAHLRFGFSERVHVFWNGALVFTADDTWHSRDITFQGVMGWWDELVLPLRAGDNELWIAVTENVDMRGGWGVQAAFESPAGLRLVEPNVVPSPAP